MADPYKGPCIHAPGDVFADLVAAVADGADWVDSVAQLLGDREHAFSAVASTATLWGCVEERLDAAHLLDLHTTSYAPSVAQTGTRVSLGAVSARLSEDR